MANVRSNLYWSTLLTMSTYVVPLLVFPYISRVLGVERIGMVDTIDSLTDCCILFAMMGMASVGVREIARHKDNRQELDQVFTDLFALNLCSTMVVAIVFATAVALSPTLQDYGTLIPIGMLKLVANLFWIEWFYTGIEDFRYITLRSITVRALFIVGVFLLIHQQADSTLYYALFAGMTVANAVYNWLHKRKLVHLNLRHANIRRYAVPFLMLGLFAMLSAIYTKLSLPVLSFITDHEQAGNFTTATRVYQVVIALVTTLTGVMIPRMSVLIKEGEWQQVRRYTRTAFKLLLAFSLPIIIVVELFATDIITLFAGPGFEGAALPMRINMLLLLIVGAEKIIILQLLVPLRKDRTIVMAGIAGVIVWAVATPLLVPTLQAAGSAIVWILAEFTVLLCATPTALKTIRKNVE